LNKTSKLELSEEKTSIKFIKKRLNFLVFRIISINDSGKYRTKIYTQKSSVKRIIQKANNIIFSNKAARVEWLILKLRPIVLGWANYYKYSECSKTFNKIDFLIWKMLIKWITRRPTAGSRLKAWNKYFPGTNTTYKGKVYEDKYILKASSDPNEKVFLPKVSWIKSQTWIKIRPDASPYDRDMVYWGKRKVSYAGLTSLQSKLLVRQNFICPQCGEEINPWSHFKVYHIISTKEV
jgi:RNA-directed DNA polymerase